MKKAIINILILVLLYSTGFAQMRDPTKVPVLSSGVTGATQDYYGLKVESIIYSPTRKIAQVNGKTLQVGDRIFMFDVLAIEREQVIFKGVGHVFSVPLHYRVKQTMHQPTTLLKKGAS